MTTTQNQVLNDFLISNMEFDQVLDFLKIYCGIVYYGLLWYLGNVVMYPAIGLCVSIILQYVCTPESKIRYFACYGVVYLYPVVTGLIVFPIIFMRKPGLHNCLFGANILKFMCKIIGVEWELRNEHFLVEETGAAVIVANHQSIFDILGMFEIWHVMVKCTAIAKKQIFWVWPFGLLAWKAGVIFIDRNPLNEKTHKIVNETANYVREQKAKLWMFPEGTRNKNPATLLPFKKGAFRQAIDFNLPIIPVVLSPYYFINGKTKYFGKGKIIICALEPISTNGVSTDQLEDIMQKVYEIMSIKNTELRREMLPEQ